MCIDHQPIECGGIKYAKGNLFTLSSQWQSSQTRYRNDPRSECTENVAFSTCSKRFQPIFEQTTTASAQSAREREGTLARERNARKEVLKFQLLFLSFSPDTIAVATLCNGWLEALANS